MNDGGETWQTYAKNVKRINARPKNAESLSEFHKLKPRVRAGLRAVDDFMQVFSGMDDVMSPKGGDSKNIANMDVNKVKKLRRGTEEFDAKLDLHGMKQQEAFETLLKFVFSCFENGKRNLLVVTGRGKDGQSILKANFPLWCAAEPMRAVISGISQAAQKHGGDGAWYVALRGKRTKACP